ncbi:MAG: hypothetical protein AAB263_09245 [Planctomycetota bacterium]
MRWLIILWIASLTALEPPALPESGASYTAVTHALQALSRGDSQPLLDLPDSAFATPPGIRDRDRPGITVPWTWLLDSALPATWSSERSDVVRMAVVKRLLANRSGLDTALTPEDLLAVMRCRGNPGLLPHDRAAITLTGWPVPADVALEEYERAGWLHTRRVLMALMPVGVVAWQTPLELGAKVWTGHGGALIADGQGLQWRWPSGVVTPMPPLPPAVVALGVDGGAAFFAQGFTGWRLQPANSQSDDKRIAASGFAVGKPESVALGAEPLGTPLASPQGCLWLTMHSVVFWDGHAAVVHRHGLPAGRGWQLRRDTDGKPLIAAPNGKLWSLPAYRSQPHDDELLGRFADLDQVQDHAQPLRFRAALRLGHWDMAQMLASTPTEHELVAHYAQLPAPGRSNDEVLIPRDPAELALPTEAWSGAVLPSVRDAKPTSLPAKRHPERPLDDAPEPWPTAPNSERIHAGLAIGHRQWMVRDDGCRVEAICLDGVHVRWFTRWLPEDRAVAPMRSMALVDNLFVIGEGDSRLLVCDATTGSVILDLRPRRLPILPGRTWLRLRPDGVAGAMILHPPGLDDRIGWMSKNGEERSERLPGSTRWLLALPDGERWLCLTDGTALTCRDDAGEQTVTWTPLRLPDGLRAASEPPRVVDGGIAAGALRWKWRAP